MRFRILGPLEIWTGQDWRGIGAPKWRSLLAALLLNPDQAVSADRLIAELWGDEPPESAPNLLSVYVLRLRRLLGDAQGTVLSTRAPGYQLRLNPDDLDARSFEELVLQGRQALGAGDPQRAAMVLTEALGLWRGSALADVPPSVLVAAEARRLEEARLMAAGTSGRGRPRLRPSCPADTRTAQAGSRSAAQGRTVGPAHPGA